jgi:hypothetical protein
MASIAIPINDRNYERAGASAGVSLRDYFASTVLPAVYTTSVTLGLETSQESIVQEAYELADAMLAERERAR